MDKVIFRTWNWWPGTVIALFPEVIRSSWGNEDRIMSYEHIGQHGMADYQHVIQLTRLATPTEYRDLANELTTLGYDLRIMKRRNRR